MKTLSSETLAVATIDFATANTKAHELFQEQTGYALPDVATISAEDYDLFKSLLADSVKDTNNPLLDLLN